MSQLWCPKSQRIPRSKSFEMAGSMASRAVKRREEEAAQTDEPRAVAGVEDVGSVRCWAGDGRWCSSSWCVAPGRKSAVERCR
jgi:hypothetical protein